MKLHNKNPKETKHFFQSKKAYYAVMILVTAMLMQFFGKFDANFADFIKWFSMSILGAQSAQDVAQALSKEKNEKNQEMDEGN